MNNKIPILFLGPYNKRPKGGIASVLAEYRKLYPGAYFVTTTDSGCLIINLFRIITCFIKFLFLISAKNRIRIIHIHGASYNSFYRKYLFFKVSKAFKKKVIYHIHGGEFHDFYDKAKTFTKRLIKEFINNADIIICLSSNWKNYFEINFSPGKIVIIPNIIENPKPLSSNCHPQIIRKFLFLSSINESKGAWLLLEVLRDHKAEIDGKALFCFGGNEETRKLKRLIHDYSLTEIVRFAGWLTGNNKHNNLADADIFILPSYNEGMPVSMLEAMSYSLPVLSTRVGGIPEIVNSRNGILFEPGNKTELWEGIQFFIEASSCTLKEMGRESFRMVKPHLPTEVSENLNKLYNDLLVN